MKIEHGTIQHHEVTIAGVRGILTSDDHFWVQFDSLDGVTSAPGRQAIDKFWAEHFDEMTSTLNP